MKTSGLSQVRLRPLRRRPTRAEEVRGTGVGQRFHNDAGTAGDRGNVCVLFCLVVGKVCKVEKTWEKPVSLGDTA